MAKEKQDKAEDQRPSKEAEYRDALQRLQAEFENFRKRSEKENSEHRKYANASLIKELLPILDSFEMALKNTKDHDTFVKGMEMLYAQLFGTLQSLGLRRIEAAGKPFDPYKHEVLLQEESELPDIVLEELQKGYVMNDLVLRHSKVKIGKKNGGVGKNG
jgi:molecular chaperone GrpE